MYRLRCVVMVAAMLALGACDNAPNPGFEKDQKDRKVASQASKHEVLATALENAMPRTEALLKQPASARRAFADTQATAFGTAFLGTLSKLSSDKVFDKTVPFLKLCSTALHLALAYQTTSGDDAAAAAPARDTAVAALTACRDQAANGKKAGQKDERGDAMRRFAGNGIVLVGVTTVAQDDADAGLKIWRQGQDFVENDMPDFEFDMSTFRAK